MNRQAKIGLLCGAVGYIISEYLVLRRESRKVPSAGDRYRYKWAVQMVLNEVQRGKYDRCRTREEIMSEMDADLEYYKEVAHLLGIKS